MNLLANLSLILILIANAVLLMAYSSRVVLASGRMLNDGFQLILEKTAALYEYAIFIALASISLSCASSLKGISNHSVISLDIIYFISILMLIMFHIFKEPESLLIGNI